VRTNLRLAATAAGAAGLLAASLLAGPALAATASSPSTATATTAGSTKLPISARQLLADRRAHDSSATATGAITGTALAGDGQPLDGICVLAYGPSGRSFATTGQDGSFLLTHLKPGTYQVRYTGCGDTSQYLSQWYGGGAARSTARSVAVSAKALRPLPPVTLQTRASESSIADAINPTSAATVNQSLHALLGLPTYGTGNQTLPAVTASGGRISGVVRNPAGHGLSGICVNAAALNGRGASFVRTGKGGRYLTGKLPAGTYGLVFYADCGNKGNWLAQIYRNATPAKPTRVHVHRSKTTSGIDVTMKLGGEIAGTVTNAKGGKLTNICATPTRPLKNWPALFVDGVSEHGVYRLRGLPAGPYQIFFYPCGASGEYAAIWWPHAATYRGAKTIHLRKQQVLSHVNAVMPLGGIISGTVTNSSNQPLAGICVFAGNAFDVTNSFGQYKATGLSPGSYTVQAQAGCGNNGNYLDANSPSRVTVAYGQTKSGINIQMPTGGKLSGTVTSAASGKPVRGVCVSLTPVSANNFFFNTRAVTGTAGTYSFDQLPTGTYYVQFSGGCGNPGSFAPQSYDNTSVFLPQLISVKAGQATTGIDAAMQPGATITGTVKDQAHRDLTGICAFAYGPATNVEVQGKTKNGKYTLANLLPGQYSVSFVTGCGNNADLVGASFGSQSNPPLISAPVGTTSGINAVLRSAGNISGRILTKSGKQTYACVTAVPVNGGIFLFVGGYEEFGRFETTNLLPGTYAVNFDPGCFGSSKYESQWYKDRPSLASATRIRVRAGHTTSGIESALVTGGSIAGRVTAGGKPVRGVCVFAQSTSDFIDFSQTGTNKQGKYVLHGLNSGRYELQFSPCGGPGSATLASIILSRLVTVKAPHTTSGVNAALPRGGDIKGTVLGGSPAVPQPNVCVEADAVDGLAVSAAGTSSNGAYTITNLPTGKYVVDIGACGVVSNLAPQWYLDSATQAHATVVSVTGGKVTTLTTVTLSTNGAVTGTVTGPSHAPLAGVCVTATGSLLPQPVVAVSGSIGSYTLLGLPPGNFRIEFSSGCGASGYLAQWWNAKKSAKTATTVKVTAATTTTAIDATMQK
jgi:5-hydroxyisourate hydrolase-like protein (transthyretin family)